LRWQGKTKWKENKKFMKMQVAILCLWMKNVEGGRKELGVKEEKCFKILG